MKTLRWVACYPGGILAGLFASFIMYWLWPVLTMFAPDTEWIIWIRPVVMNGVGGWIMVAITSQICPSEDWKPVLLPIWTFGAGIIIISLAIVIFNGGFDWVHNLKVLIGWSVGIGIASYHLIEGDLLD